MKKSKKKIQKMMSSVFRKYKDNPKRENEILKSKKNKQKKFRGLYNLDLDGIYPKTSGATPELSTTSLEKIIKQITEAPPPSHLMFLNKKTQEWETIKIPQTDEERADLLQKMT